MPETITITKDTLDRLSDLLTDLEDRAQVMRSAAREEQPGTLSMLYAGKHEAYATAHDLLSDALRVR